MLGSDRGFWWDELEEIVLDGSSFPSSLDVEVSGRRTWMHTATAAGRERAGRAIQARLKSLPVDEITQHLEDLRPRITGGGSSATSRHRVMTEDELRVLADQPNIEIGAHTVSHPALDLLAIDVQRREIETCREKLNALVGDVTSFAYPYGRLTEATEAVVRETGFDRACTIEPGPVEEGVNRFRIPRYSIEDWSAEEFESRLKTWLSES
jgi:peptidoglycan/xylan/chitin deacetylase (PgdA/CDA1 family)